MTEVTDMTNRQSPDDDDGHDFRWPPGRHVIFKPANYETAPAGRSAELSESAGRDRDVTWRDTAQPAADRVTFAPHVPGANHVILPPRKTDVMIRVDFVMKREEETTDPSSRICKMSLTMLFTRRQHLSFDKSPIFTGQV